MNTKKQEQEPSFVFNVHPDGSIQPAMVVHLWSWGGDKVFGAQVLAHLK